MDIGEEMEELTKEEQEGGGEGEGKEKWISHVMVVPIVSGSSSSPGPSRVGLLLATGISIHSHPIKHRGACVHCSAAHFDPI